MDWLTKGRPGEAAITPADVKLCELCGTLNHKANGDCFTCGWRGRFCTDAAALEIAWLRLSTEFESVRMDHITAHRAPVLGHFGQAQKTSSWQRRLSACLVWWRGITNRRSARPAEQKPSPSRMPLPPAL